MQVDAIYDKGHLEFSVPLRLKKSKLTVKVIIPDQEIEEYQLPVEGGEGIRAKLDSILKEYRGGRKQVSPAEDKQTWHQHLEDKYLK